jgi:aspartate/methionine/tyrosine aminotransferase
MIRPRELREGWIAGKEEPVVKMVKTAKTTKVGNPQTIIRRAARTKAVVKPRSDAWVRRQAKWRAEIANGRQVTILKATPPEKRGAMTLEEAQREINRVMLAPAPQRIVKRGQEPMIMP